MFIVTKYLPIRDLRGYTISQLRTIFDVARSCRYTCSFSVTQSIPLHDLCPFHALYRYAPSAVTRYEIFAFDAQYHCPFCRYTLFAVTRYLPRHALCRYTVYSVKRESPLHALCLLYTLFPRYTIRKFARPLPLHNIYRYTLLNVSRSSPFHHIYGYTMLQGVRDTPINDVVG